VIGVRREQVIRRLLTRMPVKFDVAGGPVLVQGVVIDIDAATGQAQSIRRLQELYDI